MYLIFVSHKSKYLINLVLGVIILQFTRKEPCHSIMGFWQENLCCSTEAAQVWRKGRKINIYWDFSCSYVWISFIMWFRCYSLVPLFPPPPHSFPRDAVFQQFPMQSFLRERSYIMTTS